MPKIYWATSTNDFGGNCNICQTGTQEGKLGTFAGADTFFPIVNAPRDDAPPGRKTDPG